MRVTVVGAGIAGLTTALALSEGGAEVTVIERSASLGASACSRYAGGMLAPWCEAENAEPLVTRLGQEALAYWPRHYPSTIQRGSLVLAHAREAFEVGRVAPRSMSGSMRQGSRRWSPTSRAVSPPGCSSPAKRISTRAGRSPRLPTRWQSGV
jgi:glycine/D-amino acid oxidase-like deaminating enzyme